jgi:ribonuclease Z
MTRLLAPIRISMLFAALILATACGGPSMRIMGRVVERNLRADLPAELPDGLHVLVCGAGGPLPDPKRSGPCVAIIAGRTVVVVDVGSSATRNLATMGLPAGQVDAVFLSHFHSDHIDGLGELATLRWVGDGWTEPLPVHGPTGVTAIVDGFNEAYRLDQIYRTAHHGETVAPPSGRGLRAREFELPLEGGGELVFERQGLQVRAFAVDHSPVSPAVGYRFDYKGRSVVLSGDTARSDNLIAQARGADLLVHEALSRRLVGVMNAAAQRAGATSVVKITDDILNYHASPVEAAESAEAAGVDYLLFYHIVPPLPLPGLEGVYLDGVSKTFSGKFRIAVDGTFLSLPAGSSKIRVSDR